MELQKRFKNGCNQLAIELIEVQFWSEIILVSSIQTRTASPISLLTCMISDQTALKSINC